MTLKNPQQSLNLLPANDDARSNRDLIYLALLLILIFSLFLGSRPLNNPDEGRYAEIAREMAVTGDLITPKLNGVKFFDKPVFAYWLSAISIKVFGVNEWAARLIPALFAILSCLFVFVATRTVFDRKTAWLASVILALSPIHFFSGHYVNVDMVVSSLITLSLLCFWYALTENRYETYSGKKMLLLGYVGVGLATLTKGLIGIVFPGAIVGLWLIFTKQLKLITKSKLLLGLLLFLLVTLPWYIAVQVKNPEFFDYFFVYQHYKRFLTTKLFNNPLPFWFYLPVFLLGFFPWSCYIIQAVYSFGKKKLILDRKYLFLTIWFVFVLLFFSLPKSKIISYILPVFPPASIILAKFLQKNWFSRPNAMILWGARIMIIISIILAGAFIFLLNVSYKNFISFGQDSRFYVYLIVLVLLLWPIIGYRKLLKYGVSKFFTQTSLYIFVVFILSLKIAPNVIHDSTKDLALYLKNKIDVTDEVINYFEFYHDLPFYLEKRVTIVDDWDPKGSRDNYRRYFALASRHQDTSQWLIDKLEFNKRWQSNNKKYVFVEKQNFSCFKGHMDKHGLKYYPVINNNMAFVFSNTI